MMLEQLRYKNHMNEVFNFGVDGIFVNTNELHDYEWEVTTKNNKISSLDYSVVDRKLPVVIICETEAQGIQARNRLHEVVEKDVLALQHGQIMVGDYYFKCYVTKSQKKEYLLTKRHMQLDLTLTSDRPYWVKETTNVFRKLDEGSDGSGTNLDYPYDFAFDYYNGMSNKALINTGFVATNFRMIVYGPCKYPAVYVAGHLYQVNCALETGEHLTIDSVTKKIFKVAIDGTKINQFNLRERDSYIFEKIPTGSNTVIWEGDFGFDIILLEERSEPKWT